MKALNFTYIYIYGTPFSTLAYSHGIERDPAKKKVDSTQFKMVLLRQRIMKHIIKQGRKRYSHFLRFYFIVLIKPIIIHYAEQKYQLDSCSLCATCIRGYVSRESQKAKEVSTLQC